LILSPKGRSSRAHQEKSSTPALEYFWQLWSRPVGLRVKLVWRNWVDFLNCLIVFDELMKRFGLEEKWKKIKSEIAFP
jgi:hypothetical protein